MAEPVTIGARLRTLRAARGLSLRDLATRCGVSAPMLSQVERGETSPTLAVANKIAAGLDLSLSGLLRLDEAPTFAIVRAAERRGTTRNGHRFEHLTPNAPGERASVTLHTLKPRARTGTAPLHAPGSRETAVVQRGRVDVVVDGATYELGEGDAITFDADLPHHFRNPGRGQATFYAVVTAGLRNP
jgi:transcriptional regulator with XRE-family HTH domain